MQALLCDTSVQTAEDSELLAEQELLSIVLFGRWQPKKKKPTNKHTVLQDCIMN